MTVTPWIKSLRLPVCLLVASLAVASFRVSGANVPWLTVVVMFFECCMVMLQNDWRDRHHDSRKGKMLALKHPKAFLAFLLAFWAVSFGFILVVWAENRHMGFALALLILPAAIYSEVRQIPMVPVIMVSVVFAAPALLPVVAGWGSTKSWLIFLSSALIAFGREISKDIDDQHIDPGYKWTIPVAIGESRARVIAAVAASMGLTVAFRVSLITVPGLFVALVGVALLISGRDQKVARICLDIGMALAVLLLIFFGS